MAPQIGTAQACGNCKWWKESDQYSFLGECMWNDGIVPEWAVNYEGSQGNSTSRECGTECQTWQTK